MSSDGNGAIFSANGDLQFYTNNTAYATKFYSANKASTLATILDSGKVLVGVTANQTQSKLTSRQNGSAIEFGHLNQTGQYYGTLGAMSSAGSPFIAFSADNSNANTFTTRGAKGFVISQDTNLSGDLIFSSVPLVNTVDQSLAEKMRITSGGSVGIGATNPQSKLQVDGGIQMAGDTDAAAAAKVGTMRYRTGTEYVEVDGVELVTNGDFASSTDWVLKNSASINNGTGVATVPGGGALGSTNGNWSLSQASVFAPSTLYRVRFQARRDAGTASEMYVGQSYSLKFNQVLTSNWVQYEVVFTSTSNVGWSDLTFGGVVGTTSEVKEVSVIEVTSEDASYADMCMQTGSSTYEWVNIVRNTY